MTPASMLITVWSAGGGCRDYQKKKTLEEIRKDIERINERYKKEDQKEVPSD